MAFDCFIKLDGVDGESEDAKHAKWVEVLSFSHGVSQTASASVSSGGGRSAGRTDHADFSITKTLDATSPKLNQMCSSGEHIPNVEVQLHRSDGTKPEYMNYKFNDVIITSVHVSGSPQGGDPLPMETVSFAYGKINWKYTPTDHKTGKAGTAVPTFWDLHKNEKG